MRRRLLVTFCVLAALLSACKVDATIDVRVREDGSGVVRVIVEADAEAVRAVESGGIPIEQAVRLSDLTEAGFRVGALEKAEDGSATIVISHPFQSVDEVARIVRSLTGPDGPLPELRATRERGLIATDYGVAGRIDLDAVSTGVAADEELVARLQALGVDVNLIDQQLLAQIRSSLGLKVVVRLPDQEPVTFTPKEGATTATVDASAQVLDVVRIVLFAAALGFLLLAIIFWVRGGRRRRRRRKRSTPAARRPEPAAAAQPPRPPTRGNSGAGAQRRPPPRATEPTRRAAPGPRPPGPRPSGPRAPGGGQGPQGGGPAPRRPPPRP